MYQEFLKKKKNYTDPSYFAFISRKVLIQLVKFLRSCFGIDGYMGVYILYQAIPRPNSQYIYFLNSYLHKISHLSILFQETPTCIHYSFI